MASLAASSRVFKSQLDSFLPVQQTLDAADIASACREAGHRPRDSFWSPLVTILTFLRQVMSSNCSCRQAVAGTLARWQACETTSGGKEPEHISGDPSAYSQARQKLPCRVLELLNARIVERAVGFASSKTWCGRQVVIVDGSSVQTPDTPDLQKAYPQPSAQKPGCGFPVIRLTAMFCWASGCLRGLACGSLHANELAMFRPMLDTLTSGTVVLGDRYYGSYYDLCLLIRRGLDGVIRLSGARSSKLRRRKSEVSRDRLETWTKPVQKGRGITVEEWTALPETLTVRQVWFELNIAGFRARRVELVTTLSDGASFPREKLAELYRDRWHVELNLRHLKTTLKMEVLRCQSVEMVRKELAVNQLAYNLIRLLMWESAYQHGVDVRRMSFAGTQQRLEAVWPHLDVCVDESVRTEYVKRLIRWIAEDVLPDRPNRLDPRAVKRRPKNYQRLTQPRAEARERCRQNPQAFRR